MKFKLLSLSLLSVASVSPFLMPSLTPKAMALGCVATDVAVQVGVSGSKTPAQQNNNVNQQFGENCVGNSVTSTSTQTQVGADPTQQNRTSNQTVGSGANRGPGVGDVGVQIHVPVNVYNPAQDPNFLNNLPGR